ncbi:MAG: helical backbone metal receptor [Planctomycetia bacterium]|nr:helical backbone metal receptor [Planctomycetia bacterium]
MRRIFLFLLIGLFLSSLLTGCSRSDSLSNMENEKGSGQKKEYLKIISTAPSITETLFEMGLGSRVIAVSDYCVHPKEIEKLPKIGGLYNPNYEAVIALKPDLVIVLKENAEYGKRLQAFGISVLQINQHTINGIFESFRLIGSIIGGEYQKKGEDLERSMRARIENVRSKTKDRKRPSVLISIDRQRGTGQISDVFIAGNNSYFNEILEIAGGMNPAKEMSIAVPVVSVEGIMDLNPDVVIDLATDWNNRLGEKNEKWIALCQKDWMSLDSRIGAVKMERIYAIPEDYATVPGPRVILLIERIAKMLHPECF